MAKEEPSIPASKLTSEYKAIDSRFRRDVAIVTARPKLEIAFFVAWMVVDVLIILTFIFGVIFYIISGAFEDARMKFDVRYYLVAILFILFDLEIAFLFPWAVVIQEIGPAGFWAMMVFLFVLVVGFIFEWMKGALEWD